MPDVLLVVIGLAALVAGAEGVVRGGSRVAAGLGIPPIIVGVTVVSIGTSTPELAVGIEAAVAGNGSLAIGNIAGTNVVNLLLILGLSAAIRPLTLHAQTLKLDLPVMVGAAVLVTGFAWDGRLTPGEGWITVGLAVAYTLAIVAAARRERAVVVEEYAREYAQERERHSAAMFAGNAALLVIGLVVIVLGADWLVDGAVGIARTYGLSEAVIGLTIVAIGTSAPELVTTIVSTLRGDRDIAVGNLLGSSVFNLLLILGVTTVVPAGGIAVEHALTRIDLPIMVGVALLCIPVFRTDRKVSRAEGTMFVALYAAYLTYLLIARV